MSLLVPSGNLSFNEQQPPSSSGYMNSEGGLRFFGTDLLESWILFDPNEHQGIKLPDDFGVEVLMGKYTGDVLRYVIGSSEQTVEFFYRKDSDGSWRLVDDGKVDPDKTGGLQLSDWSYDIADTTVINGKIVTLPETGDVEKIIPFKAPPNLFSRIQESAGHEEPIFTADFWNEKNIKPGLSNDQIIDI